MKEIVILTFGAGLALAVLTRKSGGLENGSFQSVQRLISTVLQIPVRLVQAVSGTGR